MEISIKWNVCRVCLQEENTKENKNSGEAQMKHIFQDENLSKQIFECSGVSMKQNDSLPDKICKKCLTVLKYATNFRTTCRNSDEYLHSVIQKTKSASYLFKLDKQREEVLCIMDDDMEEANDEDGKSEPSEEKRKQISESNKESDVKKSKIFRNEQQLTDDIKKESRENDVNATAAVREDGGKLNSSIGRSKSTDELLSDLLGEENEIDNQNQNSILEDDEQDNHSDMASNHVIKKESSPMCTVEENYIEEEDTDHVHDISAQHLEVESSDVKPLVVETLQELSEVVELSPRTDVENEDGEFFYIIAEDIKREYNCEGENGTEQAQYIDMDEDTKSDNNMNSVENVEYLLDSADEQSQSGLDYKNAADLSPKNTRENKLKMPTSQKRQKGSTVCVFMCDICGNHFTNRNLLNFHMKIHRNEKKFECELCSKRFNAACNLSAHMRTHTGEKPFLCRYCDRRFADRSTHIKHERLHTNEKPYPCDICGKAFSLSTSLKAHERVHTGEKPYRCDPCAKSFKLPHQLKAHLKTHVHKLLSIEQ